jgi:hypothetical protein
LEVAQLDFDVVFRLVKFGSAELSGSTVGLSIIGGLLGAVCNGIELVLGRDGWSRRKAKAKSNDGMRDGVTCGLRLLGLGDAVGKGTSSRSFGRLFRRHDGYLG